MKEVYNWLSKSAFRGPDSRNDHRPKKEEAEKHRAVLDKSGNFVLNRSL